MSMIKAKTLLVKDNEGEFKVELPPGAKLTFGPNVPFASKNNYSEVKGYSLRVYLETKENIIAVFTNVISFRDITLPVYRKILRESGKSLWKSDEKGYKMETEVQRSESFEQEVLKLTNGDDDNG